MLIHEAIREANTRHEVFFLLTAYVEAVGYCDKGSLLPWQVRELPLAGIEDVKARIYGLHLRVRGMTPGYDDEIARRTINDALELYTTALRRLASLQEEASEDLAHAA
ncbi:MAG TPA: hypothetical protein VD839_17255 [Burkholderiales bacterium]|nr:hypothetical protein [Burkholderiales bacterium]